MLHQSKDDVLKAAPVSVTMIRQQALIEALEAAQPLMTLKGAETALERLPEPSMARAQRR